MTHDGNVMVMPSSCPVKMNDEDEKYQLYCYILQYTTFLAHILRDE